MVDHTTRAFDADLQQLASKIAEMGRLDSAQITNAIDAWSKRDTARAKRVIATDDQVDAPSARNRGKGRHHHRAAPADGG